MDNPSSFGSPLRHLVFLDKPAGFTSHDAVQVVKGIYREKKAGHSGTLDPAVTGMLVVALGEARKAMPVLMGMDKEYVGSLWLHGDCSDDALQAALTEFTGTITQMPPVRSRVKRELRDRVVHELELLDRIGREIHFRVRCEAGTYIRTLAVDLGKRLGVGAHMTKLRRTGVGPWTSMATREQLQDNPTAFLVPLERAIQEIGIKQAHVDEERCKRIRNGRSITEADCLQVDPVEANEVIAVFHADRIHALATYFENSIKPTRVFHVAETG